MRLWGIHHTASVTSVLARILFNEFKNYFVEITTISSRGQRIHNCWNQILVWSFCEQREIDKARQIDNCIGISSWTRTKFINEYLSNENWCICCELKAFSIGLVICKKVWLMLCEINQHQSCTNVLKESTINKMRQLFSMNYWARYFYLEFRAGAK